MIDDQNIQGVDNGAYQPANKRKKIIPIIIILILLCLAGGAAVYAYYAGAFVSLPSLLAGYTNRAQELKSFKIDMNASIDFSEIKDIKNQLSSVPFLSLNATNLNVGLLASYDLTDRNNMKISSDISVTLGSLSVQAKMIILNSAMYGNISKFPHLATVPPAMVQAYENKWFSFKYPSLVAQDFINKFSAEENEHLEKMFLDAHIIKNFKRLPSETIAGESSYHFSFEVDKEALIPYMQSYKNYVESIQKGNAQLSDFDLESFKKALDLVKDPKGEVWIGRNDKLFRKVSLNFGIQPDLAKDEQVRVSMAGTVSDYNQPVSILAPAESIPFETLMQASLGEAQQKANDARIKANLANMRAQAGLFYDENYSTGYTGFCDSSELKTARKDIEEAGGAGFVCKAKAQAYAIGVKLLHGSGYWCIDSTGASKSTASLPSGTVCPLK